MLSLLLLNGSIVYFCFNNNNPSSIGKQYSKRQLPVGIAKGTTILLQTNYFNRHLKQTIQRQQQD
jgi:hypothetical protein